ncbi:TetR family transcriptional regulator [Streptomyces shenzhenensis]|uniref:TetR family transcriptional regulator n=1 Tax=Streptomyces shenzhenensis TaxID=943815 RepID=UPI003819D997
MLAAASELFCAQGIGVVGVDAVVARSGVSKPTLCAQFGSQDGLIAACWIGGGGPDRKR